MLREGREGGSGKGVLIGSAAFTGGKEVLIGSATLAGDKLDLIGEDDEATASDLSLGIPLDCNKIKKLD